MTTAASLAQSVAPGVSLGFKNRIINGAMTIDQRNAGASVAMTGGIYITDRWRSYASVASKLTAQQSSTAPVGFINSLVFTSQSAYTQASGDEFFIDQRIEGLNVSDLAWGTVNAKTVTLSFWAQSSVTGTFSGAIANSAADRNYPFTFSLPSANTMTYCTVTIPGDTTGTWLTTNGVGIRVKFNLGTGSTYLQTSGAWTSSYANGATGSVALVNTNGATFYITGVQLEVGTAATSFEFRDYGRELIMCQRYYWKNTGTETYCSLSIGTSEGSFVSSHVEYPVAMRAFPTFGYSSLYVFDGGAQSTVSSIRGQYAGTSTSMIQLNTAAGTTVGRSTLIEAVSSSSYLYFSAEL